MVDTSSSLLPLFVRAALTGRGKKGSTLPTRSVTASAVVPDAGRLVDYQHVCGFDLNDVLPAPFVHVLAFPLSMSLMAAGDFPMPLVGLVHVANTMTQHRPVRLGEKLDLSVHAEDLRPHDAGRQVDIVADAAVGGEKVWTGRSTYLQRTGPSGSSKSGSSESGTSKSGASKSGAATSGAAKDRPAAPPAGAVWRLTGDLGRRYAAVSGDQNPIHLSALSAKAFGFPKAIAHGMWTAARTQASLGARLPEAFTVDVAFKTPVFLPSTVGLNTHRTDDGWQLALFNLRSGKPHLQLSVHS